METKQPVLNQRLSGLDSAFLYLERQEIPLSVAAVLVFESALPFEEFVAHIDSRLHLLPRYRQVVAEPPLNIGYPSWEWAPHFDIREHIFRTRLKRPGGEKELEALAGRILSGRLDRRKPLWDMHVVEGLKDGRGALIIRVHHSVADGMSGMAILNIILDPAREGSGPVPKPPPRPARKPRAQPLAESIVNGIVSSLGHLIGVEETLIGFAEGLLSGRMSEGLRNSAALLPELACAVERLPFNKPCSGDRKFCWTEIPFAETKAISLAGPATVNDVILTLVTQAIARYVQLHGETVHNRLIRIVCPVNLRRDNGESMGNRISFMPVVLPLGIREPLRLLRAVAYRTDAMKRVGAADMIALIGSAFGVAPPPVQAMLWRGISDVILPLPLFNMICTNIPGSRVPLYALGRKLVAAYPQVPTGYELGINCAVTSYDGKLFFGLIADAHVAPDVTRFRDYINSAFAELCRAARVRVAPQKARPAQRKAPKPAARKPRQPKAAREAPPVQAAEPVETAAAEPAVEGVKVAAAGSEG